MNNKLIFLFLISLLVGSCGPSKNATSKKHSKTRVAVVRKTPESLSEKKAEKPTETLESTSTTKVYADVIMEYIDRYKDISMVEMQRYGIPASITLAQGILESGAGRGTLAKTANNHFGIKCHTGWTGGSVSHDDDEKGECFRKYENPHESFEDHSKFLTTLVRYAFLFEFGKGDYVAWAHGLRKAGYATDKRYPEKLISLIERYDLHSFDKQVLGNSYVAVEKETKVSVHSKENVHIVQKGDTLFSLARRYNVSVEQLMKMNELSGEGINIGQELRIR